MSAKMKRQLNKGTTLIEMVISFALLGLFVSMSTVIISNVTNLYYHVRGENYARQVGDIVTNKIASEISGAVYNKNDSLNPKIEVYDSGSGIILFDRTETKVRMYENQGILKIYYYEIDDQIGNKYHAPVTWTFDSKMYNGYEIESLDFAQANTFRNESLAEKYGISGVSATSYPGNVIAVYMRLKSNKYGKFTVCRFVKYYEAPESVLPLEVIDARTSQVGP